MTWSRSSSATARRAASNAARSFSSQRNQAWQLHSLKCESESPAWARAKHDLVLLDPPRAGAIEVLAYLPRKEVRRVVYVSCHPASLARDAGVLVRDHGFELAAAGVMDMFPHTAHVESIALFER